MEYRIGDNFSLNTGIYLISFDQTKKVYIGSASRICIKFDSNKGFNARWNGHLNRLRTNKSNSIKLQNAYNKYGEQSMYFKIIENVDPNKCIEREQYWIDKYNSCKFGYNCSPKSGSQLGYKHNQKSKEKISKNKLDVGKEKIKKHESDIVKLYNKGLTIKKIQIELNISKCIVKKSLIKNNIKIRNKSYYTSQYVYVYSKLGELLSEHISVLDCSKYYNVQDRGVWSCINKHCKTLKENIYSIKKMAPDEIAILLARKKSVWSDEAKKRISIYKTGCDGSSLKWINVKQIDENGNLVKFWHRMPDAVKELNLKNASSILRCIKNERKTFKKCKWEAENIR